MLMVGPYKRKEWVQGFKSLLGRFVVRVAEWLNAGLWHLFGGLAEWSIAPVLKTGGPKGPIGSNPIASAMYSTGEE